MGEFFKRFGWGILYILILPFFLIALAITTVYCLISFLVELVINIASFFSGKPFFAPLPEEVEADEILKRRLLDPSIQQNYSTQNNNEQLSQEKTNEPIQNLDQNNDQNINTQENQIPTENPIENKQQPIDANQQSEDDNL